MSGGFKERLKEGSTLMLREAKVSEAMTIYKNVLDDFSCNMSNDEEAIVRYALAVSMTVGATRSSLFKSALKELKISEDKASCFPVVYLLQAILNMKLHNYDFAQRALAKAKQVVINKVNICPVAWPEVGDVIPETRSFEAFKRAVDNVESNLSEQRLSPVAECRGFNCKKYEYNSAKIYADDVKYKGFVRAVCDLGCHFEFHKECWKEFLNWANKGFSTDMDFLAMKDNCLATGCNSQIKTVEHFGTNGTLENSFDSGVYELSEPQYASSASPSDLRQFVMFSPEPAVPEQVNTINVTLEGELVRKAAGAASQTMKNTVTILPLCFKQELLSEAVPGGQMTPTINTVNTFAEIMQRLSSPQENKLNIPAQQPVTVKQPEDEQLSSEESCRDLIATRLPQDASEQLVLAYFQAYGPLTKFSYKYRPSACFCFVRYKNHKDEAVVLAKIRHKILGRYFSVSVAEVNNKRSKICVTSAHMEHISKDSLSEYLSRYGATKSIQYDTVKRIYVVEFEDPSVAHKLFGTNHMCSGYEIRIEVSTNRKDRGSEVTGSWQKVEKERSRCRRRLRSPPCSNNNDKKYVSRSPSPKRICENVVSSSGNWKKLSKSK